MTFSISVYEKNHPSYDNLGILIEGNFGQLFVNWKPEPIRFLMKFFFKR